MTEAKFYTQNEAVINGKHYWLQLIVCPIGNIMVVQHEMLDREEIESFVYYNDYEKANKKYTQLIGKAVKAMSK